MGKDPDYLLQEYVVGMLDFHSSHFLIYDYLWYKLSKTICIIIFIIYFFLLFLKWGPWARHAFVIQIYWRGRKACGVLTCRSLKQNSLDDIKEFSQNLEQCQVRTPIWQNQKWWEHSEGGALIFLTTPRHREHSYTVATIVVQTVDPTTLYKRTAYQGVLLTHTHTKLLIVQARANSQPLLLAPSAKPMIWNLQVLGVCGCSASYITDHQWH